MTDQKAFNASWEKHRLHVLQSLAWHRVQNESAIYVIADMPTLVLIKPTKLGSKHYAQVLRAGHDGFACGDWATELVEVIAREHPGLTHIEVEPYGIFTGWPKEFKLQEAKPVVAQHTVINDLSLSEDEILTSASKSHRQNVRKGIKNGLVTEVFTKDDAGFNRFIDVMRSIATTGSFFQYSEDHYLKVWKELSGEDMAFIVIGTYEGEDIGAYLVANNVDTAFQFYGGRTSRGRDLKLSQALAFKTMMAAKELGVKQYDMWGIGAFDENGPDESDELYGIGQFKLSFGGTPYKHGDAMICVLDESGYKKHISGTKLANIKKAVKKKLMR